MRKAGAVRTSRNAASTSGAFSVSEKNDTSPADSSIADSTLAAMSSSLRSNSSPVIWRVPPVRIAMPVKVATPTLPAGSKRFPVRMRATPPTTGAS